MSFRLPCLPTFAPQAMHAAKIAGRNQVRFYEEQMNASTHQALIIDEALQQAISASEPNIMIFPEAASVGMANKR